MNEWSNVCTLLIIIVERKLKTKNENEAKKKKKQSVRKSRKSFFSSRFLHYFMNQLEKKPIYCVSAGERFDEMKKKTNKQTIFENKIEL